MLPMMTHDGQSMIVKGSLVDKQNEPKTTGVPRYILYSEVGNVPNVILVTFDPIVKERDEPKTIKR